MGYTTEFEGAVKVEPTLTAAQMDILHDFAQERHGGNCDVYAGFPGFWCNWEARTGGTEIGWNGSEKFYDSDEWMKYIIENFLKPWGVTANGEIIAQGEDISDRWLLVVQNNEVSTSVLR